MTSCTSDPPYYKIVQLMYWAYLTEDYQLDQDVSGLSCSTTQVEESQSGHSAQDGPPAGLSCLPRMTEGTLRHSMPDVRSMKHTTKMSITIAHGLGACTL